MVVGVEGCSLTAYHAHVKTSQGGGSSLQVLGVDTASTIPSDMLHVTTQGADQGACEASLPSGRAGQGVGAFFYHGPQATAALSLP